MKLSVLDLSPIFENVSPTEALRQSVLLAQTAERLGYARYWAAEHHDMPQLASSCPEVLLSHIGAQTSTIRLGSGAVLLPHYRPMKVAETFHLLATLYPGRIDLGIGRAPGGSAHATIAISGNFLESVHRLPDALQELTELLTNRFRLEGEPVIARPVPPVPPELWLLGTNRKSAQFAARCGAGYVFGQFMSEEDGAAVLAEYRSEYKPSELTTAPKTMVAVGIICADTEAEAQRLAREGMAAFLPKKELREASGAEPYRRRAIVGDPEQVLAGLRKLESEYGTDEFIVISSIPEYAARLRSYELLADAAQIRRETHL